MTGGDHRSVVHNGLLCAVLCSGFLHKTEGKLEFTTTATHDGRLLRFIPLYQAIGIRFADYLTFKK